MTAYETVVINGQDYPPEPPLHTLREFRWYHLTLLAAFTFALGIVAYNAAVA